MRLPPILKDLIPTDSVKQMVDFISQPNLVSNLKDAAQQLAWKETWGNPQIQQTILQAKKWIEVFNAKSAVANQTALHVGINATGQVFGTPWTTHPMDSQSISRFAMLASGYNTSPSLRSSVHHQLQKLTGGEMAIVVHSPEQAISLLRFCNQSRPKWALPLADAIRLPESASIVDLIRQHSKENHHELNGAGESSSGPSGLIEFGASNECSDDDIQHALSNKPTGFIYVSPSQLESKIANDSKSSESVSSTHSEGTLRHRIGRIAIERSLPVIEILLHGSLVDLSPISIRCDYVHHRLSSGATCVLFSGDGFNGGPPLGILVGKRQFLAPLEKAAQQHGMLASPLMLGLLSACLDSLGDSFDTWKTTSVGQVLSNSLENLMHRAAKISLQIEASQQIEKVSIENRAIPIAPGSNAPELQSTCLKIIPKNISAAKLAAELSKREVPLWVRTEPDSIVLALRTIDPADDPHVVAAFVSSSSGDDPGEANEDR